MSFLQAEKITYSLERTLFKNLSFELCASQLIHIRGANGAGKTTLLRLLLGLLPLQNGKVHWFGEPLQRAHYTLGEKIFYQGVQLGLKMRLSVRENMSLWLNTQANALQVASDKRQTQLLFEALGKLQLADEADTLVEFLSAGQQRRLALSRLLLSSAQVWVLDEPFAAVDHQGVELLKKMLETHLQMGGAAICTSHQVIDLPLRITVINLQADE